MSTDQPVEIEKPADPQARLELNRSRMRERLAPKQEGIAAAAHKAVPQARGVIRRHPYASLAAAAVAGALVAQRKPWRALRGSPVLGSVARRALALSGFAGGSLVSSLVALALDRQGKRRQP
jgi:ElaB/YqjD/DUF883 family membrane-anchored ribosome-binding protein